MALKILWLSTSTRTSKTSSGGKSTLPRKLTWLTHSQLQHEDTYVVHQPLRPHQASLSASVVKST